MLQRYTKSRTQPNIYFTEIKFIKWIRVCNICNIFAWQNQTKRKMKKTCMTILLAGTVLSASAQIDTTLQINNVVVTGTRTQTDVRHLPFTLTVLGRQTLTNKQRTNILPTLTEQVPGLFVTSRGLLGYGVSTNAAGGINMRGISGGSGQLMVLIDGHPQYNGI